MTLAAGTYTIKFYAKAATADGGAVAPGYVPVVDGSVKSYVYGTYINNLSVLVPGTIKVVNRS